MPFTLGIITARGGSKGIKDKNIVPLNGRPLIHYSIDAAKGCDCIDDLVLSTDSQKIADIAERAGLSCEGLRPDYLSTDAAKSADVLKYEIELYQNKTNQKIDTVILLQPTAPLRCAEDIDKAYDLYVSGGQKSLISCYNADFVHPQIMYEKEGETLSPFLKEGHTIVRRQEMKPVYVRNGAIYIFDCDYFLDSGRTVCEKPALYEMPKNRSINIDAPDDLELAAFFMQKDGVRL